MATSKTRTKSDAKWERDRRKNVKRVLARLVPSAKTRRASRALQRERDAALASVIVSDFLVRTAEAIEARVVHDRTRAAEQITGLHEVADDRKIEPARKHRIAAFGHGMVAKMLSRANARFVNAQAIRRLAAHLRDGEVDAAGRPAYVLLGNVIANAHR